jgi:DNA polymerase-3 subunit gamma/tau
MFSIKYKTKNFEEMVGQSKIKLEFIKRSKTLDFSSVMFFIGNQGGGKTSTATIISKMLNCHTKNITGTCNCPSCKDIDLEKFNRDVHLFNASQMSKDDVNQLENLVAYYPTYDKNKIIIIDESQHLSSSAKGSTKKLLEKKRDNVYFILCTSDEDAFTPEIKRRGQVYLFKEVPQPEIAEYLMNIIKKEGLFDTIDESFITEGIFTIAGNCNGSPGYALSLLERCVNGEIYSEKDIIKELGIVSDSTSSNILEKLLKRDLKVFEDLKNIELKEFYFKNFKILLEAYIYAQTGFIDQEWKLPNAKRIASCIIDKNLDKLLEAFNNTEADPYFKESSFYYEIIKYFGDRKFGFNSNGEKVYTTTDQTFIKPAGRSKIN